MCTVSRVKLHIFLSMQLDFRGKGNVHICQDYHVADMIDFCPVKIKSDTVVTTPASNTLFQKLKSKLLTFNTKEKFNTCIAKGLLW